MSDKEYTIDITLKLRIKDVKDEDEAICYIEDFQGGIHELLYSSDSEDDHYDLDMVQPDWDTFTEWS